MCSTGLLKAYKTLAVCKEQIYNEIQNSFSSLFNVMKLQMLRIGTSIYKYDFDGAVRERSRGQTSWRDIKMYGRKNWYCNLWEHTKINCSVMLGQNVMNGAAGGVQSYIIRRNIVMYIIMLTA